jgi:lysine 2,3-aminomutase
LGGKIHAAPTDIPNVGRFAVVADPQARESSPSHIKGRRKMTSTDRANLRTPAQLLAAGLITEDNLEQITEVSERFAVAITPHVHSLIEKTHPADPIAAQFVPTFAELNWSNDERADPIGDEAYTPTPGIVHRYPDRVLLKPLHACPVYCRFCFRREMVGPGGEALSEEDLEKSLAYIESKEEIWEVVITGGDPLIMSPRRIKKIMQRLEKIKHVGVVRYHTRVPVVKPEAITQILIDALRISKAVYIVLHANHVQELSAEAKAACAKLIDSGFPMLSQTVLLNGVNADPKSLERLFRALVEIRIKPYYLHHGDLAKGTKHFRTSIAAGQQIMRELRGNVSGICQPQYVLDIPGGNGKVPIGPGYLTEVDDGNYIVRDYQGNAHGYQDSILP